jgi:anti-anti-sigma factor
MATTLTLTCSRTGPVVSCVAIGELDLATVDDLRTAVLDAARRAETLRLDLSGIRFVDTAGLGALLELHVTLERAGVVFEISVDEGPVRHAVQITGLAHLLTGSEPPTMPAAGDDG